VDLLDNQSIRAETESRMSENQIRAMIEMEAKALGLSAEDAIARVQKGDVGENFLWRDMASLIHLLE
jgi:hypothetical protein